MWWYGPAAFEREEARVIEQRDEEEAALDERDSAPPPGDVEADEADVLEQSRPVRPLGDEEPETVGDAPEADALEQARGVQADDEDDERP
jgi:hypothetical protein